MAAAPVGTVKPAVVASKVRKSYPLFGRRRHRLAALAGRTARIPHKVALDGVSLEAYPGEALGIIGENGSGKSTLLRIVAGITRPDEGELKVTSPVAAILELGMGFHPDFTGRENALLYGSLMGIPREDMAARLEDILAFAELGEFADQPLRTYSSGMAARLAFAVATEVDPEVLVVDEALAVGDGAFQKRCVDRMRGLKDRGRSVLFCSHSLYLVTSFCEKTLWLRHGKVEGYGNSKEVVEAYSEFLGLKERDATRPRESQGSTGAKLQRPRILRLWTEPKPENWQPGRPFDFHLELEAPAGCPPFHAAVSLDSVDERCIFFSSTQWEGYGPLLRSGRVHVTCRLELLPLGNGKFWVNGFLFDDSGLVLWDRLRLPNPLTIQGDRWNPALLQVPHKWDLE